MSTLIIPAAGRSSRFPNMKPKWMLTHPDGKLMIEKAISGLPLKSFDRIIITILKEYAKNHEARTILEQVFKAAKLKIEVLELAAPTTSQSETVLQTLVKKHVTGPFVVKDSDNYVEIKSIPSSEFVVGLDINKTDKEITRLKSKSFLVVNNQNIIVDIVEKRITSENICIGVYAFESRRKFEQAYYALFKNGKKGELYLSHVISYLIGTGKSVYSYVEAKDYEDWGTMEDWKLTQQRHSTYFIDVDGILLKNQGKYGKKNWSNHLPIIEENIATVQKLSQKGAQIILTTSRGEEHLSALKKLLKKRKILVHAYITGCNHAPRIIINDFAPTNPYPSCKAVNVPRNGLLDTYL